MASVVLIQFLIYWQSWLNVIFLGENLLILVTSWWLPSIKFTTAIHPKTWEHRRWCSLYSWLLSLATVPVQPRRTRKGAFSFDNSTSALVDGDTGGTFFCTLAFEWIFHNLLITFWSSWNLQRKRQLVATTESVLSLPILQPSSLKKDCLFHLKNLRYDMFSAGPLWLPSTSAVCQLHLPLPLYSCSHLLLLHESTKTH